MYLFIGEKMDQKSTTELLHILTNLSSSGELKHYVADSDHFTQTSFSDYYNSLPHVKEQKYTDLIRKSGIERTYFYQIMNGRRQPGRDKVILLSLAAGLSLKEVQRALEITQLGILYSKNRRDAILIFAFTKELDVQDTQDLLAHFDEKTLM